MRFRPDGPDIPDDLVTLQEKGETIFICGAGVSRMVGFPSFRGLVERVYSDLGEDWRLHPAEHEVMRDGGSLAGQYDRVLRGLERRLAASDLPRNRGMRERIRAAVRAALLPTMEADLSNHLALLELSRDEEGQSRLITTNFDTLFERAWHQEHNQRIASHAGAAMPQPKVSGFAGVLHLHGRLADDRAELALAETDLVLTSAEFGDAYLRSGWASRYVYDVVRAHTLVLVGYEADDPPMRYLLEVLEADRERYPDLHQVYAFAFCEPASEGLVAALWRAKGVEPILYAVNANGHFPLYDSLREWRNYARDPTAWRKEELRSIFAAAPNEQAPDVLARCTNLLSHGDAAQLLGELSPSPDWLSPLLDRRVFSQKKAQPGPWLGTRVDDAHMIRAALQLPSFSEEDVWQIERALQQKRGELSQSRLKAWQLILKGKRPRSPRDQADKWYMAARYIKDGETGHESRQLIRRMLQPQLAVAQPWRLRTTLEPTEVEGFSDLVRIDFECARHPSAGDILQNWPKALDQEVALFRVLERALVEALEEARDVGYLDGWDRANSDVPSVATHPQNAHHFGFYPIVRVLADLWERIASRDKGTARTLVSDWLNSPYQIVRRIYIFAVRSEGVFDAEEMRAAVEGLDDEAFWIGSAQVEIMRLIAQRWEQLPAEGRRELEGRIRLGPPRTLFPNAFQDEDDWISVRDSAVTKRLARLKAASCSIAAESQALLDEIAARHPRWVPGEGDRDDFSVWHESRQGPNGEADLLANIADQALVAEAMRLQKERQFDQGDIWRVFSSADPARALRGLRSAAEANQWEVSAWRDLIWATTDKGDDTLQYELASVLIAMPEQTLSELLPAASSWLQKRRTLFAKAAPSEPNFLTLWDKFADLAYRTDPDAAGDDDDRLDQALSEPAGSLAWTLLDGIADDRPAAGKGLSLEQSRRFTRAVRAPGQSGLFARVVLVGSLAYLDSVDHQWVSQELIPYLGWDHPQAAAMWKSRAYDHNIGSARLFNALKSAMLETFEHSNMSDRDLENFMAQLLSIALAHKRGEALDYDLSSAEIRRGLSSGPDGLRANAAWQLWRAMGEATEESNDKAVRWRQLVGPLFQEIWPLDASLRSEAISRNLLLLTIECGEAFPDAVDAVLNLVVPFQLYSLEHTLRLEPAHDDAVRRYPRSAVRLANAVIDPAVAPIPGDLADFLQICIDADPSVAAEPAYIRLFGLRRQRAA
jgi:NAD-dependent SIR2 family protein deacetylase